MDKKKGFNSRGVALLVVLGTIIVIVVLAMVGISFTLSNFSLGWHVINSIKALSFAEAGVRRAMYKIKVANYTNETWSFINQPVKINITDLGSDNYNVTSDTTHGTSNKQIRARINNGTTVEILEWEQLN